MLGKEKIEQVGSFTYVGCIINKDVEYSENIKTRMVKVQGFFFFFFIVEKSLQV